MRALSQFPLPPGTARLAEALMTAAAVELSRPLPSPALPRPAGVQVRSGRLNVGRVRRWLPAPDGVVTVLAGFGTAAWLGPHDVPCPRLGRLVCRSDTRIDRRGRVVLGRQVRAWLAVADAMLFEAVLMPVPTGGVLVVPVEGFARRAEAVTP
jgi:hypothetical protein